MKINRINAIMYSSFVALACLVGAIGSVATEYRLDAETPVFAKVGNVWSAVGGRQGPTYYAQLIFDRKDKDGAAVHCDIPKVPIGGQAMKMGDTIKVVPRIASCWDPYLICKSCIVPTKGLAWGLLVAAFVFGSIALVVTRRVLRDQVSL